MSESIMCAQCGRAIAPGERLCNVCTAEQHATEQAAIEQKVKRIGNSFWIYAGIGGLTSLWAWEKSLDIIHAVDPASLPAKPFDWLIIVGAGAGLGGAYIGMSLFPSHRFVPAVLFALLCGIGSGLLAVLLFELGY